MKQADNSKAKKTAKIWICSLIAIGFLLPASGFAAYVNVVQFIAGWEPVGGNLTNVSTFEAMQDSGSLLMSHWLLYLIFAVVAYKYIVKRPDQFRQRKWMVAGGVLGLVVASLFFSLIAAGYMYGNEYDLAVNILIIGNGIFGLIPGAIAVFAGALLGYLAFKLVRHFDSKMANV